MKPIYKWKHNKLRLLFFLAWANLFTKLSVCWHETGHIFTEISEELDKNKTMCPTYRITTQHILQSSYPVTLHCVTWSVDLHTRVINNYIFIRTNLVNKLLDTIMGCFSVSLKQLTNKWNNNSKKKVKVVIII